MQLSEIDSVKFLGSDCKNFEVSNYFCTILTYERDGLATFLLENNVYSSFRYWPIHKMKIFSAGCAERDYPIANYMAKNALNLPIHDALTIKEVQKVCEVIKLFFR